MWVEQIYQPIVYKKIIPVMIMLSRVVKLATSQNIIVKSPLLPTRNIHNQISLTTY